MYGKLLEIENAVFPENIVFSKKHRVFCRYDIFIGF